MRIFIENSGYELKNLGDVAMLQVALERMRGLWPDASFDVLTASPERLRRFCPGTRPIVAANARERAYVSQIPDRLGMLAPVLAQKVCSQLPGTAEWIGRARMRLHGRNTRRVSAFLGAIKRADLVVATGGGYLTDVFAEHVSAVLSSLTLGARYRKCTAMLGQGLGPLNDPTLRVEAATVLRSVDLITLRECRAGDPLLAEIGVRPERIITTGDDTIELAYGARPSEIGTNIGVNLRIASYSEVDHSLAGAVASAIASVAREYQAPLAPVPISLHEEDSDARSTRKLLAGLGLAAGVDFEPQTPLDVIQGIGRCRVVVTGSYHAGVFALSQGIPVVGLTRSAYYSDKFLGLSEQFGIGCSVVQLDGDAPQDRIVTAIRNAWRSAEYVRSPLLAAARDQIQRGHAAYERLSNLVAERQRKQQRYYPELRTRKAEAIPCPR